MPRKRIRGALRESGSSHVDDDSKARIDKRTIARDMYFTTRANESAKMMTRHLTALTTRNGETLCVDDMSGEVLTEAGARAARILEMDVFLKMGV